MVKNVYTGHSYSSTPEDRTLFPEFYQLRLQHNFYLKINSNKLISNRRKGFYLVPLKMSAVAPGGSGGGRKPTGPPKKNPDYRPGGKDDDDNEEEQFNRLFCAVCNKYLRVGQTLRKHRRKCVGPRDFYGDFVCRYPGCGSRYRHYHDLQFHWRRHHPGVKQPASMAYTP